MCLHLHHVYVYVHTHAHVHTHTSSLLAKFVLSRVCLLAFTCTLPPPSPPSLSNSTSGESLYQLLGLQKDATQEEITKAYRKVSWTKLALETFLGDGDWNLSLLPSPVPRPPASWRETVWWWRQNLFICIWVSVPFLSGLAAKCFERCLVTLSQEHVLAQEILLGLPDRFMRGWGLGMRLPSPLPAQARRRVWCHKSGLVGVLKPSNC